MDTVTRTHYPSFHVLAEQEAWDPVSRDVVVRRLHPTPPQTLNAAQVATLRAVAANLLYESRGDVLDFVIFHVDNALSNPIGESERQPHVLPQRDLITNGLQLLDAAAYELGRSESSPGETAFSRLDPSQQASLLQQLQHGTLHWPSGDNTVGQQDVFSKLLTLTVDAWASHPAIWSDIGYAGPAYPRGYYRIEVGLTDPWEARRPPQAHHDNGESKR